MVDSEPYTITFSKKEADDLLIPTMHDALVISLYISNFLIKKIQVDIAYILQLRTLKELKKDEVQIIRHFITLVGFYRMQQTQWLQYHFWFM